MKQKKHFNIKKTYFWILLIPLVVIIGTSLISFAMNPIIISSDSMAPTLNIGDVIFTREINDYSNIRIGEDGEILIIKNKSIFINNDVPSSLYDHLDNSTPIIHRAIEKRNINGTYYFITKGDNNPHPDGCVRYVNVINESYFTIEFNSSNPVLIPEVYILGKVVFVIPFIGYFKIYSNFISIYLISLILVVSWFQVTKGRYHNEKKKVIIYSSNIKSKNSRK